MYNMKLVSVSVIFKIWCRRCHATLIDGKSLARRILYSLTTEAATFERKYERKPLLTCILIGDRSDSLIYVKNKVLAAEKVGELSLCVTCKSGHKLIINLKCYNFC